MRVKNPKIPKRKKLRFFIELLKKQRKKNQIVAPQSGHRGVY